MLAQRHAGAASNSQRTQHDMCDNTIHLIRISTTHIALELTTESPSWLTRASVGPGYKGSAAKPPPPRHQGKWIVKGITGLCPHSNTPCRSRHRDERAIHGLSKHGGSGSQGT